VNHQTAEKHDHAAAPDAVSLIDIGGRRLAFGAMGAGTPTVVLETGLGAESAEWAAIQQRLAPVVRVCRYDRANRGASDPALRPRTARDMVADLHTALEASGEAGPYVLVGHSFGGLLVRLYAHLHRDRIAGLVLADAMHEEQFDVFGSMFPPQKPDDPQPLRETRDFWTGGWRDPASTREGIDFPASIAQARAITGFGDLPVHVLTAGTFLNQPMVPAPLRPELQSRWEGLQQQFLGLSSRATQSFVRDSGHFVQRDAPDQVVAVIKATIEAVRAR
jgi:pimeloyl-ACP methyl ester carboxylesterase